jgi:hypothetical protein
MKKLALAALTGLAAAATVVASGAATPPQPTNDVVGHVYVNDNTAGTNTVAGFDRHADGTLTPIPGSPFSIGGAGTGSGTASQGALQLSDDGHFLLAVDAGSNQISVIRIAHDGSLELASNSPISSGGVNPVSIAVSGKLVYVANQGPGTAPGDTNYTGFRLDGGQLKPIDGSTVVLPNTATPGQVLFNADGSNLVGTQINGSAIDSFTVGKHGILSPAPGSPFSAQAFTPPQGYGQLGSIFSPTNTDQLFVTDAHTAAGGPAPGLVSSFTDDTTGELTPIAPSPVDEAGTGTAACWIEISHDGAFLYVVNTASKNVSTYSVAANGSISFLQSTAAGALGAGAEDARLAPDGATLWVVQAGADAVTGFSVSGGTLTPVSTAAGPAGASPTGIVVT